jgi:hypothetical protein
MEVLLLLGRIILAAVFALACVAKLADVGETRRGLREFGIPTSLAGPLSRFLPLLEGAAAAALMVPSFSLWGAGAALLLLTAFTAGIAMNLVRGRRPDCRCFGQLKPSPLGVSTLARNALLASLAGAILVGGPGSADPALAPLAASVTPATTWFTAFTSINLAVSGLLGWIGFGLWQQQGRLLRRIDRLESNAFDSNTAARNVQIGLPVGAAAPNFKLRSVEGESETLTDLLAGSRSLLLLFVDAACGPCDKLLPIVVEWQRTHADLRVVPIFGGAEGAARDRARIHGLADVLLQPDYDVASAFRVPGTPSAVAVAADGTIAHPLAAGIDSILSLVATLTEAAIDRQPSPRKREHSSRATPPLLQRA